MSDDPAKAAEDRGADPDLGAARVSFASEVNLDEKEIRVSVAGWALNTER
jgi:hypothetical protein